MENVCILVQSARGVHSHFNFDTPLDGASFVAMGVYIVVNTLMLALLAVLLFPAPHPSRAPICGPCGWVCC